MEPDLRPVTGPASHVVIPNYAQADRDLRQRLAELKLPPDKIDGLAKASADCFSPSPHDGMLVTALPSGGKVLGPAGPSRLAYELAEEYELRKLPWPPEELRRTLKAMGAPEAVIAANEGRVRREKDGRIMGQPVKSGTSVLLGYDDVITRIATQVMEQYAEDQRLAEPISHKIEADIRNRQYGI